MPGHTNEGIFFLIELFGVGRSTSNLGLKLKTHTSNPDLLRQEDTPLIWATIYAGNLHKEHGRRMFSLFACFDMPSLTKSLASPTLDPTALGFWYIFKTSSLVQTHGLNNYYILSPSIHRQPLLDYLNYSFQVILINSVIFMCVCV